MTIACMIFVCLLASTNAVSQEQEQGKDSPAADAAAIAEARTALEKWVQTRKIISQEKRDWALGRRMLEERISLVEREITGLREKIAETDKSITDAEKERAERQAENDQLRASSSGLAEQASVLEARTLALLERLADVVVQEVKPLSQRLPRGSDSGEVEQSLSQRFQNVVGILNQVDKFNTEIRMTSEVRQQDDGSASEVTVVYFGLGQAFYVGGNGKVAGVGLSLDNGWVWKSMPQAAEAIARTIAIIKNEEVASFVNLPVLAE